MIDVSKDVLLKGEIWANAIDNLKGNLFDSQWQIYALCVSIGIMYDGQDEFESTEDPRYIPRTVLHRPENTALLEFMFQTAILTSSNVNLGEEDRLELAFAEKTKISFDKLSWLTKFANYGVKKIADQISEFDDLDTMESLMSFLNTTYEQGVLPSFDIENVE